MKTTKTKLLNFLNSHEFGQEIFDDCYGKDNKSAFLQDQAAFNLAQTSAQELLKKLGKITDEEIKEACARAFSGRLSFDGDKFEYIAGQFYDLEIPQAVLAVAWYIERSRDQAKSLI